MLSLLRENKQLFKNFTSLGFLQITNYLIPLILVPYLIRTIGLEYFGLISFAQALLSYFIIITDYGFNLTATRQISLSKNDQDQVSTIISSVYIVKVLLCALSFIILVLLVTFIPKLAENSTFLTGYLIVIGQTFIPFWFFQGMEQMKFLPWLNIVARLLTLVLIFTLVGQPEDYMYVLPAYAAGSITAGFLGLLLLLYHYRLYLFKLDIRNIKYQIKDGFYIMISSLSNNFSLNSGLLILGIFADNLVLGYYSTAEKMVMVLRQVLVSFYHATYPRICLLAQDNFYKVKDLIKKIYVPFNIGLLVMLFIIFLLSDQIIIWLIGEHIEYSSNIFKIIVAVPFIVSLNIPPNQILLAYNEQKLYMLILIVGSTINVALNLLLIPVYEAYGTAVSLLITEILFTVSFYVATNYVRPDLSLIKIKK